MANSTTLQYNTLDVFTTKPFTGNPLGVIRIPAPSSSSARTITQAQKQAITREFNYSECTFINQRPKSSSHSAPSTYDVQIFTPKSELPFAGHPTIGTAVWIFENLEKERDEIVIELKAGQVRAEYERARGIARCAVPSEVRIHGEGNGKGAGVGWDRVVSVQPGLKDLAGPELRASRTPFVSPVKGMAFALVDLSAQPELLEKVVVTKDDIATHEDLDEGWQEGLLGDVFYVIQPDQGDGVIRIRQRVMVIELEDPATGAACCTLAAYLALVRSGQGEVSFRFEIEQGVEMGRASKIFVEVTTTSEGNGVEELVLKGQAVEVMSGQVRLQS